MVNSLPLQSLYLSQSCSFDSQPPLCKYVGAFLNHQIIDWEEILGNQSLWHFSWDQDSSIHNWRNVLTASLLASLSSSDRTALSHQIHGYLHQPWNQQSQYLRVLIAVNQSLVGIPIHNVDIEMLEKGAVPIELKEYFPSLSLPYAPYHAELGLLLCMLASLTKQDLFKEKALQLGRWHFNLLDANDHVLSGLFSQEKDGAPAQHFIWNYLLFKALHRLTGEKKFRSVADSQMKFLEELSGQQAIKMLPLIPLLEQWIENIPLLEDRNLVQSSSSIYDPTMALVGIKDPRYHAICTLHGGYTGLGSLSWEDVAVVNYGPQHLPLGECQGFGIEGNYCSDHGIRQTWIERQHTAFSLKGCVRLVDQPMNQGEHSSLMGKLSGVWLETEQSFRNKVFCLNTRFLGFEGWGSVAFSFFIKASSCRLVNTNTHYYPKTFERYEGKVQEIILEGKKQNVRLISEGSVQMQIIPLGGGDSFWGADFLIAYMLSHHQHQYQWSMTIDSNQK